MGTVMLIDPRYGNQIDITVSNLNFEMEKVMAQALESAIQEIAVQAPNKIVDKKIIDNKIIDHRGRQISIGELI